MITRNSDKIAFGDSESLRLCEDFIGQPRDFPKKQTVVLPKPEPKEIPPEETWQEFVAEQHREKKDLFTNAAPADTITGLLSVRRGNKTTRFPSVMNTILTVIVLIISRTGRRSFQTGRCGND